MYVCLCVYATSIWESVKAIEEVEFPRGGVTAVVSDWTRVLGAELGPLQEQQTLFTLDSYLQPNHYF